MCDQHSASPHERRDGAPQSTAPQLTLLTGAVDGSWTPGRVNDIAAVLEEFDFLVVDYFGGPEPGAEMRAAWLLEGADLLLDHASLLVCDAQTLEGGPPVEITVARMRGVASVILIPWDESVSTVTRHMMGTTTRIVRHNGNPAAALHGDLIRRGGLAEPVLLG